MDTIVEEIAGFDVGLAPLFDLPFEREKFPGKTLEYMALRVPTVCSRVGTIREVIREGEDGLLAGSEEEWEEHLAWLIADEPYRQRIAEAGYQTFASRFTIYHTGPLLAEGLKAAAR